MSSGESKYFMSICFAMEGTPPRIARETHRPNFIVCYVPMLVHGYFLVSVKYS